MGVMDMARVMMWIIGPILGAATVALLVWTGVALKHLLLPHRQYRVRVERATRWDELEHVAGVMLRTAQERAGEALVDSVEPSVVERCAECAAAAERTSRHLEELVHQIRHGDRSVTFFDLKIHALMLAADLDDATTEQSVLMSRTRSSALAA